MSKYLLSYDEADVEAGLLNVTPDGVLKGAGGSGGGLYHILIEEREDGYRPKAYYDYHYDNSLTEQEYELKVNEILEALLTKTCIAIVSGSEPTVWWPQAFDGQLDEQSDSNGNHGIKGARVRFMECGSDEPIYVYIGRYAV